MNLTRLRTYVRRDGWLLAALGVCVVMCMLLGVTENKAGDETANISRVLSSMEGAGQVEVALFHGAEGEPRGAVVVADGAGSVSVRLRLTSAVATLLGLDPQDVAVYPSERSAVP